MMLRVANLMALAIMPFFLSGVIQRVKSLWSGRKGPPIFQMLSDVVRLLRKTSVYSTTTTAVFRIGPYVVLFTALVSAFVVPLLGSSPIVSFPYDFVWLAYVWGLGRVALMLAALDTGSSFEGMGTAREATFATLLEPAWFLIVGALGLLSGTHTLHEALVPRLDGGASVLAWFAAMVALTIILQVENARVPADDPSTHLELTMVHEVMILDHSGRDLAAMQVGAAIKFFVGASLLASLLNPWSGTGTAASIALHLALCTVVAIAVGTVESLIARFQLRAVPQYVVVALSSAGIALLATAWRVGGVP